MSEASAGNLAGERAVVVPRATQWGGSSSIPLESWIAPIVQSGVKGLVVVVAPPGGGKTTAMRHLKAVLPGTASVSFFDSDEELDARLAAESDLAILFDTKVGNRQNVIAMFDLSPWTLDDCVEYLAVRHRTALSSVMTRLSDDPWLPRLKGSPQLLRLVMDWMVDDSEASCIFEALRKLILVFEVPEDLVELFVTSARLDLEIKPFTGSAVINPGSDEVRKLFSWHRHEAVQRVYLARWVANELAQGRIPDCLHGMGSKSVLAEIATMVMGNDRAIVTLDRLLDCFPGHAAAPMVASVLLRIDPNWRPKNKPDSPLNLSGALLACVRWAGIDLENAQLDVVDMTDADLQGANLRNVEAAGAKFWNADLSGACLDGAKARGARFDGANLSSAQMNTADMINADFTEANLTGASLTHSLLKKAVFTDASLRDARLLGAAMEQTEVTGADFAGANLMHASLKHVQMSEARWDRVSFRKCDIYRCNLEGLEIIGADFTKADLMESLLTGSRMIGAKFYKAILVRTGLAEIEWENADLRGADMTNAAFHLGSSRSGLVGSTIPCEGSRTGFYTDEFNEQDFKSPEEIRKACLRGADLRGAVIERVDFYLVDLRGAKYSAKQGEHFTRCGAILVSRVA
jgi:uncharacterized protein YjbI with pentapeptide repeats